MKSEKKNLISVDEPLNLFTDEYYMRAALRLAVAALGRVVYHARMAKSPWGLLRSKTAW